MPRTIPPTREERQKVKMIPPTPEEWRKAKAYFKSHPEEGAKFSAQDPANDIAHTFRIIEGRLIATQEKIGEGGNAKIRKAVDEKGNQYALRVEANEEAQNKDEAKVTKNLKYSFGETVRKVEPGKKFKDRDIDAKKYTLTRLIGGKELHSGYLSPNNPQQLTDQEKLKAALEAAKAIHKLHDKNVLHNDIKAQNFMMEKGKNGSFKVVPIDFGYAMQLKKGEVQRIDDPKGTEGFKAREINRDEIFSKASDIHALGVMFRVQMGIEHPIIDRMMSDDATQRPTLKEVEKVLSQLIKQTPPGQTTEKSMTEQIKNYSSLNDKEKQKLFLQLSQADWSKEEIHNIDIQTLTDIKNDVYKLTNPDNKFFTFNTLVFNSVNMLGKIKCYEQANSLEEVQSMIEKHGFQKGFVANISQQMEKKIKELKISGKSDSEIKSEFSDFLKKFDFSFYGLDSVAPKVASLVERKYSSQFPDNNLDNDVDPEVEAVIPEVNALYSNALSFNDFAAKIEAKKVELKVDQKAPHNPPPQTFGPETANGKENVPTSKQENIRNNKEDKQPKLERRLGQVFIKQFDHHVQQDKLRQESARKPLPVERAPGLTDVTNRNKPSR